MSVGSFWMLKWRHDTNPNSIDYNNILCNDTHLNGTQQNDTQNNNKTWHKADARCWVVLHFGILSGIMLNVIMLNVIILTVSAPKNVSSV